MNEFLTYEYVVSPNKTKKIKLRRFFLILLYVIYCIAGILVVALAGGVGVLIAPLIALMPVTCWILVFVTWRYANIDCEYSMTSGIFTYCRIYGGKSRHRMLKMMIHDMEFIAPKNDMYIDKINDYDPEKVYDCTSGTENPDLYFALFENDDGKKSVLYFEATARALQIMRHYNTKTVVSKVRY